MRWCQKQGTSTAAETSNILIPGWFTRSQAVLWTRTVSGAASHLTFAVVVAAVSRNPANDSFKLFTFDCFGGTPEARKSTTQEFDLR